MMRGGGATAHKLGVFVVIMSLLTAFLFVVFGQYRTGSTNSYSAVFADASRLKSGDTVRVAGVRVGTVKGVRLRTDKSVLVRFDADRDVVLTAGTRAAVRYLNLTGDRYLELLDLPSHNTILPPGSVIPVDRTAPALDLDLLLGGLKPVVSGLNPQDVNALTSSLIQIFQGEGGTFQSLLSKTSSFSTVLADNNQTVQQLIDNLNTVLAALAKDGDKFSGTIDSLERLVSGLAEDRDPIGAAIASLDAGTASIADLLAQARPPLAGVVEQLSRAAPVLDHEKDLIEAQIKRLPENYRKLVRIGSYGSFISYYICGITFRVSDQQGRTAQFPWWTQEDQGNGRCREP